MPDNILVIGGGFAGFWAAVAARRVAGARTGVTLVSREPMLEIRPRLYEAKSTSTSCRVKRSASTRRPKP
jgi:NADH dehydrogenase